MGYRISEEEYKAADRSRIGAITVFDIPEGHWDESIPPKMRVTSGAFVYFPHEYLGRKREFLCVTGGDMIALVMRFADMLCSSDYKISDDVRKYSEDYLNGFQGN